MTITDSIREISPVQAKALLDAGEAVLLDVREAEEFAEERIAGALLSPLSKFEAAAHAGLYGKRVIVTCLAGARSARAVAALLPILGSANVVSLAGGMMEWQKAGLPVIAG